MRNLFTTYDASYRQGISGWSMDMFELFQIVDWRHRSLM